MSKNVRLTVDGVTRTFTGINHVKIENAASQADMCDFCDADSIVKENLSATPSESTQTIVPLVEGETIGSVTIAPIQTETVEITANGEYDPTAGKYIKKVTVAVPQKEEQALTIPLSMGSGDQTISPEAGKLLSRVIVLRPGTLIHTNIKNGVSIGGVTGSYTGLLDRTVRFVVDNADYLICSVAAGKRVSAPVEPTKTGHVFVGWVPNIEEPYPRAFPYTPILTDETLYAYWA